MNKPQMNKPQSCISFHTIMDFLNETDILVDKLQLIGELGPYVDEAPIEQKARLAIGLLSLVADYTAELSALSDAFTQNLPRGPMLEGHEP